MLVGDIYRQCLQAVFVINVYDGVMGMDNNLMETKKMSQETFANKDMYAPQQNMYNDWLIVDDQLLGNMNQSKTNLVEDIEATKPEAKEILEKTKETKKTEKTAETDEITTVTISKEELSQKDKFDVNRAKMDYSKLDTLSLDDLAEYALSHAKVEGVGDGFLPVVEALMTVQENYKNILKFDGPEQLKANRASFSKALTNMRNVAFKFYDSKTFFYKFRKKGRARLALCKILKSDETYTKLLSTVDNRLLQMADSVVERDSKRTIDGDYISDKFDAKSEGFVQEAVGLYSGKRLEYQKYKKENPAIDEAEKKYVKSGHIKRQPFMQLFKSTQSVEDKEAEENKAWNEKVNTALTELNGGNNEKLYSVLEKRLAEMYTFDITDEMLDENYIINNPSILVKINELLLFYGDMSNKGNFEPLVTNCYDKLEKNHPTECDVCIEKCLFLHSLQSYYATVLADNHGISATGLAEKDERKRYTKLEIRGQHDEAEAKQVRDELHDDVQLGLKKYRNKIYYDESNKSISPSLRYIIDGTMGQEEIGKKLKYLGDGSLSLDKLKTIMPEHKLINDDTVFFLKKMDDQKDLLNRYIGKGGLFEKEFVERNTTKRKLNENLPHIDPSRTISSFLKPVHFDGNQNYLTEEDKQADIWNKGFVEAVLKADEKDCSELKKYTLSIMDEYTAKGYSLDMIDYEKYKVNYDVYNRQVLTGLCIMDNFFKDFPFLKKDIEKSNPVKLAVTGICSELNSTYSNCITKLITLKTAVEFDSTSKPINGALKDKYGHEQMKNVYNMFTSVAIVQAETFKTDIQNIYSMLDKDNIMSEKEKNEQRAVLDKLSMQANEIVEGIKAKTDELLKQAEEVGKIY